MKKKIVDVNELHVEDVPFVGGKGANLGELTNAGFPVPEAFVLTTVAYDYFIDSSKIFDAINKEIAKIDRNSDDSLAAASDRIRGLFEEYEIPADLRDEIVSKYKALFPKGKTGFVAVRSSATAEDLPDASFAGQQETYLNVKDEDDLFDKIRKCWSSLFTARAIAYREKQGYSHSEVKLAVVVQRMVNSEFSGIMFTKNPNNGADQIIIEAGYGLGEAIVGGEVTPDTYVVDKAKRNIIKKIVSSQSWKYIRGPKGGVVKEDMPEDMVKAQKIPDKRVSEIAEIGRQIEIHYDKPMDMEWCVENDKVYIVQARPITVTGDSATNESVESVSSSALFSSFFRRSRSLSISTSSASGRYTVPAGVTAETASSPMPLLSACVLTALPEASAAINGALKERASRTFSLSETMKMCGFFAAGTFRFTRARRTARTTSLAHSMRCSSSGKSRAGSYSGQALLMMVSSPVSR